MVMKSLNTFINGGTLTIPQAKQEFASILDGVSAAPNIKSDLNHLFQCALRYSNPTLFPTFNINKDNDNPLEYMNKWTERYLHAIKNKPSSRAAAIKNSVDDPILKIMIKTEKGFDDKQVDRALDDHNLYMSAENIQGSLLEEYIDTHISKYGWIWAEGETIRACDFIKYNAAEDKYDLLQIKNKYNSENSSSSAIRKGKKITKWYRLGQKKQDGKLIPAYQWKALNEVIGVENEMSEQDYVDFIMQAARKNKNLLI